MLLVSATKQRSSSSSPKVVHWTGGIIGYSALSHCVDDAFNLNLARILLEAGASPNPRNKYAAPSILPSMMRGHVERVHLLMEFGADIDVANGDGVSTRKSGWIAGPEISAVISNWELKRAGKDTGPLGDKTCASCGRLGGEGHGKMYFCIACQMVKYCSAECQGVSSSF